MKKIGINLKKKIKLNNTYRSKKRDIKEALDELDKMLLRLETFIEKHPKYNYILKIEKNDSDLFKWVIELNIKKND